MSYGVFLISPDGNLSRYLRQIHSFPMLSEEEERTLARLWRDDQDIDASHKLVTAHLRLVAKIALGFRGYGLPVSDLISEGSVGLIEAVKRFDPDRGFRLSTYAIWWIRAAMQEFILRSWSLVKVGTTAAQKKLFFNLRRLKSQMQAIDDGDLQPEQVSQIAKALDLPEQDVVSMNRRLAAPDNSLNVPMHAESHNEWQDSLADETETQEGSLAARDELNCRKALLADALETLQHRERQILIERRLTDTPATLEVLSGRHGISCERVRQIEVRALEKLQKTMKLSFALRATRSARPKTPCPPIKVGKAVQPRLAAA